VGDIQGAGRVRDAARLAHISRTRKEGSRASSRSPVPPFHHPYDGPRTRARDRGRARGPRRPHLRPRL